MRRAFTLVQLLVAMAIIAILSAITTSVVVEAKRRSQDVSCLTRLGQIGKALFLYAADHDDLLPPYASYAFSVELEGSSRVLHPGPKQWRDLFQPYAKSTEIFFCPRDSLRGQSAPGLLADHVYTSFVTNLELEFELRSSRGYIHRRLSSFPNPSEFAYCQDDCVSYVYRGSYWCVTPHGLRANGIYLDGHVSSARTVNW